MDLRDWMSQLPQQLWDTELTQLTLPGKPGSHDAMSYCLDINSPLLRSESDSFRILDKVFSCFTRPTIFKWATTQDKSIEEQLSMGIRYFDLRVAHKPHDSSSDLYFTHVIYTHLTVLETLLSVESWLESHPREIVVLALSHFEGMNDRCHESFIHSLKKLFGSKLCPRTESVLTLRSLWASGYQVILSYDDHSAARHEELWPDVPYNWANQRTAQGVIGYLDRKKDVGRPDGFFVSGLNLTADRYYITTTPSQTLRTLTLSNWACLQTWLQQQLPGSDPHSLNIVAGDFVGTLPLCSVVVALNHKLLHNKFI
ncbi:PI-PLC X domain-containing protein 1 isoform X1 [Solea solea]|uniref:PI-PLC X domain-containing protein 1 isoform X1 n=1 Tax=Solea solea TaxID=90069 RepID=UPI002729CFC4|nr:PI-PLC X domain-containing protein 1 isoform X1 [Solea solea]